MSRKWKERRRKTCEQATKRQRPKERKLRIEDPVPPPPRPRPRPRPAVKGATPGPKAPRSAEGIANDIRTSVRKWFNPPKGAMAIECSLDEYHRLDDLLHRRLYLYGEIFPVEEGCDEFSISSMCNGIAEAIMQYNREDYGLPVSDREPIRLYINSPGGDMTEGFPLIAIIEASKTPIYTINVGKWDSMGFYIGIAGQKRYALPYTEFLLHEGYNGGAGSTGKVNDKFEYDKRFENEVVRKHVLKYGTMTPEEYDARIREEIYMFPEDAKKYGFIDEIVTDLDAIL